MSLAQSLNDEKLRKEAWIRRASTSVGIEEAAYDFGDNGWPYETVLNILKDGAKYGRGSPHWNAAVSSSQQQLLSAELVGPSSFIQVLLDPATGQAAFKNADMIFKEDTLEDLAKTLAKTTHQSSSIRRNVDFKTIYGSLSWQAQSVEALRALDSGVANLHPLRGEDALNAWDRDFDRIDAYCEKQPNPITAMDVIRRQYMGSKEDEMIQHFKDEVKAGPNAVIAENPARVVTIGAKGQEIRAAIPLKKDGSIDTDQRIVVMTGQTDKNGLFRPHSEKEDVLSFYNVEALAKFSSSAQNVDLGEYPVPEIGLQVARRRELASVVRAVTDPKVSSSQKPQTP